LIFLPIGCWGLPQSSRQICTWFYDTLLIFSCRPTKTTAVFFLLIYEPRQLPEKFPIVKSVLAPPSLPYPVMCWPRLFSVGRAFCDLTVQISIDPFQDCNQEVPLRFRYVHAGSHPSRAWRIFLLDTFSSPLRPPTAL